MKEDIAKRIEKINNGIVPEGYKKTKVGIVPVEWEIQKIKDFIELVERPIKLKDDTEYELVTIRRAFGGIDSRGKFLGKSILVKNYFILQEKDFVISKRQISHGACGIVPYDLNGAVVSNEYNIFIAKNNTDIMYFNFLMQHPYYKRLFYLMSDGVHIEKLLFKTQDWMKRAIAFPPFPEQQKIAEILSTQDKLIELQARKVEQLQTLKKGYLQKMFPKKGCKYPELRFKGFTDAWEQRELGDICEYHSSSLTAKDVYEDGSYDLYDANSLIGKTNKGCMEKDYITIIKDGAGVGRTRLLPKNSMFLGTMGALTPRNSDLDFLYQLITKADLGKTYTGSTIPHIYFKDYGKNIYCIPSCTEQQQIGSYFRNLDNLITLHQRKLDQEKQKKKSLMQLLLTGKVRIIDGKK